jgi:hypothetical protein
VSAQQAAPECHLSWSRVGEIELPTSASRTSPRTRYQATCALHDTTWCPLPPMLRPARGKDVGIPVRPPPPVSAVVTPAIGDLTLPTHDHRLPTGVHHAA